MTRTTPKKSRARRTTLRWVSSRLPQAIATSARPNENRTGRATNTRQAATGRSRSHFGGIPVPSRSAPMDAAPSRSGNATSRM